MKPKGSLVKRIMELYHSRILDLNRHPRHLGTLEDVSLEFEAYNPLCGDEYKVYLKLDDGLIDEAKFSGYGCAVSKASADILVDQILGRSLAQAQELVQRFLQNFEASDGLGHDDLDALQAARKYPMRIQCAKLAWTSCDDFLGQEVVD